MAEAGGGGGQGGPRPPLRRMDRRTRAGYLALLALTSAALVAGAASGVRADLLIAAPVVAVLAAALLHDREFVHVPPGLAALAAAALCLALAGDMLDAGDVFDILKHVAVGVAAGTAGLIVAYISLGRMPGFADEKPMLITVEALCFGIATYALWLVAEFYFWEALGAERLTAEAMASRLSLVSAGCALVSAGFFADRRMQRAVAGFLRRSSGAVGIDPDGERREVEELIAGGESDRVEFKSTLRTNLQTGERDRRMERAALKTVVAFLNTDGGSLLVGVSDSGEVLGVDMGGFGSRDRLNLHVTNLISSQIGDEYIPFIRFRLVDFGGGREVLRFACSATSTPAFLKDGGTEAYFVRAGPSSVELHGRELIRYADNRRRTLRGRKYAAAGRGRPGRGG